MDREIFLNKEDARKHLLNTDPYVFVDEAVVIPGKSANGKRYFPKDEWFFKAHFPNNPIVPAVFQLEVIMQTGALAIYTMDNYDGDFIFAQKFKNFEVYNPVHPEDILYVKTEINSIKRGIISATGYAYLLNKDKEIITCKAEFQMIQPKSLSMLVPSLNKEGKKC